MLRIDSSPGKGRGVFAAKNIAKGEVLERAPIVIIPENELLDLKRTILGNYYFKWGSDGAIALGTGSLMNHSYEPNCVFQTRIEDKRIDFTALIDIREGEELTVNYNGDPSDRSRLWFKVI